MKKYLSVILVIINYLNSSAQQWVLDEIAEERQSSDPLTLFDIVALIIFAAIVWLGYKFYKYLKSLDVDTYKIFRNDIIIGGIIVSVLLPISINIYYDIRNSSKEKEAVETLNTIINNASSYIEFSNEYPSYTEIEPRDNQAPNNRIDNNFAYRTLLEIGATPYQGVYRCFNIHTFGSQVIFAKYAKEKGFSTEENPALFHGWIKPYRIRYYSNDNVNPDRDLRKVYGRFIQDFIWEHQSQRRNDISREFFHRPLNEFYEISHIPVGDEMWQNNKVYYENDYSQGRTYEYKTIRYGDFDITYCIDKPCKIGVCERYIKEKIFGKELFDKAHKIAEYKTLAKYCTIWGVIFIGLIVILYFGNPSKNRH